MGLATEAALALALSPWLEFMGDMTSCWEFQLQPSPGFPT